MKTEAPARPEALVNHSTGSIFPVVAGDHHLLVGIRFGAKAENTVTVLFFRIRIEEWADSGVALMSFHNYVKELWPEVKWTGMSQTHVSITGATALPVYIGDTAKLLSLMEANNVEKNVLAMLKQRLPGLEFFLSDEDFYLLMRKEISEASKSALGGDMKSAIIYSFAGKDVEKVPDAS